jgi:ectoine hydroxylase-related dioxygenase (phytanoyl-CoA dioxygenase family)
MDHLAFQGVEGEVDVPVRAGDVVIGDSRLLHSARANQTDQRRTVLTIWYWPAYDDMPDEVKALIRDHITSRSEWADWVEQTRHITEPFLPVYEGEASPVPWGTFPGEAFR